MKSLLGTTFAAVLLAGQVHAGGTTLKSNVTPLVDRCDVDHCLWNISEACVTNADCNFGTVSAKSKVSLTGAGRLRLKLSEVTDPSGMALSGDFILYMGLARSVNFDSETVVLKVPVADGSGALDLDISAVMVPAGQTFTIAVANLYTPPVVPLDCPGANTPADIAARADDADCITGQTIATVGFPSGGKGSLKSNLVPFLEFCDAGLCKVNQDESCITNADCNFGTVSPKSKASLAADGRFKLNVSGVTDAGGAPVTANYLMNLLPWGIGSAIPALVEVPLIDGKAKVDVDLGSFLPAAGVTTWVQDPILLTPPAVPADCPSGNDPATIAARAIDPDCLVSVEGVGLVGVAAE